MLINTDPQRRCYNGCNYSEKLVWGPWEELCFVEEGADPQETINWWKELNDIAVRARGKEAEREFRIKEAN